MQDRLCRLPQDGNFKDKIPRTANGCHKADDSHAGRFGQKCNDCHDNLVWQPVKYDHLARTKFALIGVHAKLDCHTCHTANAASRNSPPTVSAAIARHRMA